MPVIAPVLILGIGNILLQDEGAGVHVVRKLQHMSLSPEIEIIDGGTLGLDLFHYLEGRKKVILVDTIQTEQKPGTIYRFRPEEIQHITHKEKLSFHQVSFFDVLRLANFLDPILPELIVIAVRPKDISPGMDLTPEIEAKIPTLIDFVMEEVKKIPLEQMV